MSIILPNSDPMGVAIADYFTNPMASIEICVHSDCFDEDVIPVNYLFRDFDSMPQLEQLALNMANGLILDIGSGAGSHSLELQNMGKKVVSLDNSQLATDVQKKRGVVLIENEDIFQFKQSGFDTLLCLMNGVGISGSLNNLPLFLTTLKNKLTPTGQILIDSSDLTFLFENTDGSFEIDTDYYFGELEYKMSYKNIESDTFPWLFIDYSRLYHSAIQVGLKCEKIFQTLNNEYLARLSIK